MENAVGDTNRTAWSALTILLVVAIAAGCTDKSPDADGSTTTVKPSSTTTSTTETTVSTTKTTTPDDAVLSAYLAFWNMYIELGGNPPPLDPESVTPRLDELTTGAEKAQLFDFLQKNAATGLVLRGEIDHSPVVESNDGTVAVVRDCLDDRTGVYRVADDTRVDTDDPARHMYVVTLRQDDGQWRVETVSREPESCTV